MKKFSVISGEPGTGKTTTVTKILALLIEQKIAEGEGKKINLFEKFRILSAVRKDLTVLKT